MVLLVSDALVTTPLVEAEELEMSSTAEPGVATSPVSVNWLFEMLTSESVAPQFSMSTPFASVCVQLIVGEREGAADVRGVQVVERDAAVVAGRRPRR